MNKPELDALRSQISVLTGQVAQLRRELDGIHDDAWAQKYPPGGAGDQLPNDSYAYVGTLPVEISGTPCRYVWVNVAANPPTAEYLNLWVTPFPDGYVIYDLAKRQIHIPRLG